MDLPPGLVVVLLEMLVGLEPVVKGEEDVHALDQVRLLVLLMHWDVQNCASVFREIFNRNVDLSLW